MAIFLQQQTSEYKWAVWKMDESEEQLLTLLPHHETYLEQMKTFTAPHRRQEWLSIRVLLYQMLGEEKKLSITNVVSPLSLIILSTSVSHIRRPMLHLFLAPHTRSVLISSNMDGRLNGSFRISSVPMNSNHHTKVTIFGHCFCIGQPKRRFINTWISSKLTL
jgi:hypothetical protein